MKNSWTCVHNRMSGVACRVALGKESTYGIEVRVASHVAVLTKQLTSGGSR